MALLKAQEVRQMSADDRQKRLTELRGQLMHERGVAAMGGSPPSPGKIRQIRTAIARILTIQNQERAGKVQWARGETPRAPSQPTKKPTQKPEEKPAPASRQGRVNQQRYKARHAARDAKKAVRKPAPKPAPAKKSQAKKSTGATKAAAAKKNTKKEA